MIRTTLRKLLSVVGLARDRKDVIAMTTRQMTNFLYYASIFQMLAGVKGDVVECGVGKGRSFLYFNFLAFKEGMHRTIWGFDSFEGFPEPTKADDSARMPKKGDWGDVRLEHIDALLRTAGLPEQWVREHTKLVKGFFNESLVHYNGKPIALLHLDGDLYESYKHPLETLFPLIVSGGIVLLDEYDDPKWPGAKRAVDEFFKDLPYKPIKDQSSGKHYVIKR